MEENEPQLDPEWFYWSIRASGMEFWVRIRLGGIEAWMNDGQTFDRAYVREVDNEGARYRPMGYTSIRAGAMDSCSELRGVERTIAEDLDWT